MVSPRFLLLLPFVALAACASHPVDRQVEFELADFHTGCLSAARPAYSQGHIDCVLERYAARQRQLERLRTEVFPPPPPEPGLPPVEPGLQLGPDPNFMI
jgi:hypothetical protein